MILKESVTYVNSHRDTHFTDSLVQYASEYEDIAITPGAPSVGTTEARSFITSLTLRTATNHAWAVSFHRTSTHSLLAATPYVPSQMIDFWSFLAADALPTATEWIYAVTGMKIPYRDENNTGMLHVGLHNESSSTKGALGATLPSGVNPQYVQLTVGLIAAA